MLVFQSGGIETPIYTIDTFIESYDRTNKTIIPFATSGGSGMGKSCTYIQKLAPKSKVTQGKRLSFSITDEELNTWASSMIESE